MKRLLAVVLIVIFMTMLLPLAVIWLMGLGSEDKIESGSVSVYIADEGRVADMDINEYLKGVVAAEMPADFESEALKAQTVAARTFLYSRIEQASAGNIDQSHNGAAVCTDYTHCQAYILEQERKGRWGDGADEKWNKISDAVESTSGQIMTYNGGIISAVFHSTSSGNTEAAKDVWGEDIPYLQSVASAGDEQSPKYTSELSVSEDEFKKTVDDNISGTDWSKELFGDIHRSPAGGIISMRVGGVDIKGTEFRSIFALRSTNVDITREGDEVKMSVRGYGHGVGMSQYGANYLASQGKGYEEILKTYYTGIEIEKR